MNPNGTQLLLISGAVGSGKTTLASNLARIARDHGLTAASIDMDDMVSVVAGTDWSLVTHEHRVRASKAAGELARHLLDSGHRIVAIAGSTLSQYEWDDVLSAFDDQPAVTYVLLRVSVDEATRRAQLDPARSPTAGTRNPDVVAHLHRAIDWTTVRKHNIEINTDHLTADEVVETVWRQLGLTQ